MMGLRFKSIAMRIWTTFTIIILIIICSISLIYVVAFKTINDNAKMQDLKVAHDELIKGNSFKEPPSRFDELRNLEGIQYFIVNIDKNNNLRIMDINRKKDMGPLDRSNDRNTDRSTENEVKNWMAGFINGENLYEKEFKENYSGRRYLFIISSISSNVSSEKLYLVSFVPSMGEDKILYIVGAIGILFIAIGFLTAKIVAGYISRPLKELEAHTLKIAAKDWKEPIELNYEDEIGRLAAAMNQMQRELKRADEEEKMFLQSISHDLKTPVMVIMSHAEAILDGVYIDSVEKTAEVIKEEAIGLEKKIKQLLYLNTLDYVLENNSDREDIYLNELLNHMVSRFEVVKSEIEWDLNLQKVTVNGNYDKIKVSIENILENGLRYASEKIALNLKEENGFTILEIYNDGPNIDEKHLNHIFDNHYKDKTGNFGLGLAISKKIIDFYKGEIQAVNREKGVSFIVKFPVY